VTAWLFSSNNICSHAGIPDAPSNAEEEDDKDVDDGDDSKSVVDGKEPEEEDDNELFVLAPELVFFFEFSLFSTAAATRSLSTGCADGSDSRAFGF